MIVEIIWKFLERRLAADDYLAGTLCSSAQLGFGCGECPVNPWQQRLNV